MPAGGQNITKSTGLKIHLDQRGSAPIYPICVVEHAERTGTARLRGARHLNNKFGQSQGSQHDELGFVMMEVRPLETIFFTGLTPPPLQQQGDPWSL